MERMAKKRGSVERLRLDLKYINGQAALLQGGIARHHKLRRQQQL
jgi:hypothetical protein